VVATFATTQDPVDSRRTAPGEAAASSRWTRRRSSAFGSATQRRIRTSSDGARILVVSGVIDGAYVPHENSPLGGPETLPCLTASTSMSPTAHLPSFLSASTRIEALTGRSWC
jgi:hypothetical protein